MQHWSVVQSSEGYFVRLVEVPWWARLTSTAIDRFDGHTGHVMCGSGAPDWLWEHCLGTPQRDPEDGFLVNSIAAKLHDLFNWLICTDWRHERELLSLPIDEATAESL